MVSAASTELLKLSMTKSIGTLVRATLVCMQHGWVEVRKTVLNWAPICLAAIPPSPHPKHAHAPAQLDPLSPIP
jgi:hypothetical protein